MSAELLEKSKPKPADGPVPPGAAPSGGEPPRRRDEEDEVEPGFFRRHGVLLALGALVAAGAGYAFLKPSAPAPPAAPRKAAVPINVTLPPPPLPPPPPPKVEPPKVEQSKEQMEEETAPVDAPPEEPAPEDSPPPIGTNNAGPGPADGFGLGKATAGSGNGTGRKIGGGGGSRFGYYAGQVQNTISAAIKRNARTRSATMSVTARIWADETGRITRAVVSGSSGDPAVDEALRTQVLTGLQLQSPPPPGMKMPINLRLTARPPR